MSAKAVGKVLASWVMTWLLVMGFGVALIYVTPKMYDARVELEVSRGQPSRDEEIYRQVVEEERLVEWYGLASDAEAFQILDRILSVEELEGKRAVITARTSSPRESERIVEGYGNALVAKRNAKWLFHAQTDSIPETPKVMPLLLITFVAAVFISSCVAFGVAKAARRCRGS